MSYSIMKSLITVISERVLPTSNTQVYIQPRWLKDTEDKSEP